MRADLTLGLFLIFISTSPVYLLSWENEDTVIIEASEDETVDVREKRQFPSLFPSWPIFPSRPGASCYAASGNEGECTTLKQCYPIIYSVEGDGNATRNSVLGEMLRNASGPCEVPVMGNYFSFKADAEARRNFICCSQNKRPFKPWPPTGIKVSTTNRPGIPKPPTPPTTTHKPKKPTPGSPQFDTPSSCGIPKVVGGDVSSKGRHPWIVALTKNGRQFCGGSLISNNFVLTAAHCVSHMTAHDVSGIRVHLGEHTLGVGENTEQFEKVSRVLYHKGFSHRTLHNDVALLKLASPARESSYIRSVCLSQNSRVAAGNTATLAGWGQLYDGGPQATTLREVDLKIWSDQSCRQKYAGKAPAGIISSMICAGGSRKDACRGDSGGPLTMKNSRNVYEQIGVVSWGIGCGTYPGVYTKVSAFLPWINKNRKL